MDAALELAPNGYTAMYASQMIASLQTAAQLSAALGIPISQPLLGGMNEIGAGIFEGTPEIVGAAGIRLFTTQWVWGNRYARIPRSVDGFEFNDAMSGAIQAIYDDRDVTNPNSAAFSHLDTIWTWTAMNVKNPALLVMITNPLDDAGHAVITGNPQDGWTLVEWNGVPISPEPTLPMELFIDTRTLNMQISDSAAAIEEALLTLNPVDIATTTAQGAVDITRATVQWAVAVVTDIVGSVTDTIPATLGRPTPTHRTAANAMAGTFAADSAVVEPESAEPPADESERATAAGSIETMETGDDAADPVSGDTASSAELTAVPGRGQHAHDARPAVEDPGAVLSDQATKSMHPAGSDMADSDIAGSDIADNTVGRSTDQAAGAGTAQNAA